MFDHLKTLLWLKLTLTKHTWSRFLGARVAAAIGALILLAVVVFSMLVASGVFLLIHNVARGQILPGELPFVVTAILDIVLGIFLFVWFMGLFTEIQRSDLIDFRKMLFLPVSLKMVFTLNVFDSAFSTSLPLFAFPVVAAILALVVNGHRLALLGVPLAIAFYFMLSAWTYFVRGFLVALMENKRRRRTVIAVVTLGMILVCQLPNIVFHTFRARSSREVRQATEAADEAMEHAAKEGTQAARQKAHEAVERAKALKTKATPDAGEALARIKAHVLLYNKIIPLGWFPYGMHALLQGNAAAASLCFAGCGLLGILGFSLGFRSTWRFYMGVKRSRRKEAGPSPHSTRQRRRSGLMFRTLPFFEDDTASVALSTFLTYLRHPNVRIMFVMPVIIGLVIALVFAARAPQIRSEFIRNLILVAAIGMPALNAGMIAFNVFGVDRRAFRTLMLLPTERRTYFLGKNLALLPIIIGQCIFLVGLASFFTRPRVDAVVLALMQAVQLTVVLSCVGNFMSIRFPFRMQWDAMRSPSTHWTAGLAAMLGVFLLPPLMAPTMLCLMVDPLLRLMFPSSWIPAGILLSGVFLCLTALVYRSTLASASTLLLRREQTVLDKLMRGDE